MILLFCLIAAAAMSRLLPHPDNTTPIMAVALFAAAYLPSRRLSILQRCCWETSFFTRLAMPLI
jgi:hypothetical protein